MFVYHKQRAQRKLHLYSFILVLEIEPHNQRTPKAIIIFFFCMFRYSFYRLVLIKKEQTGLRIFCCCIFYYSSDSLNIITKEQRGNSHLYFLYIDLQVNPYKERTRRLIHFLKIFSYIRLQIITSKEHR